MIQTTLMVEVPLAPQVLHRAGVPLDDALWLTRLPKGRARFQAMRTVRGEAILSAVRSFTHQVTTQTGMQMSGA